MKPNEPSRTALIPARHRAAHRVLEHGSILNDPFAMKILGEDEKGVLQFANGHPLVSIGRLFTVARSRIAEDALSRAVERGIRQIVIMGAGLDTFALRSPYGARQIRIYEVDHPATQAWKRQRLAEAQLALPPCVIFAPVDFERDDLGEKLASAGLQQNAPAFFIWLGVVPYLSQDAIGGTLGPHVLKNDQAGRHVIELLANLLTDLGSRRAAVGAGKLLGTDVVKHSLARQARGQLFAAMTILLGRARAGRCRSGLLRWRLRGRRRLVLGQDFAGEEQELVGVELLRPATVDAPQQ
jgi:methyltransferase (TIGR00027 family)